MTERTISPYDNARLDADLLQVADNPFFIELGQPDAEVVHVAPRRPRGRAALFSFFFIDGDQVDQRRADAKLG